MLDKKVIVFLVLATALAVTHYFAVSAYLYWYYWWFDILMHFWGGILVGFGVHVLATFKSIKVTPNLTTVLIFLVLFTGSWEIFERMAGLFEPATYIFDTLQDIVLGFAGGLLAHFALSTYRMK